MMTTHKLLEIESDIGALTLELIGFPHYIWAIITESKRLEINGGFQIGIKTPYSEQNKSTVINIAQDQHQVEKQYEELCRQIANQIGCFVVLSVNTDEMMSISDLRKVSETIKSFGKSMVEQKCEQKQQQKSQDSEKQQTEKTEQTEQKISKLQIS